MRNRQQDMQQEAQEAWISTYNDYLDQYGADEEDGRYRQYPEYASGNGKQDARILEGYDR